MTLAELETKDIQDPCLSYVSPFNMLRLSVSVYVVRNYAFYLLGNYKAIFYWIYSDSLLIRTLW